jgi:hypothetical protein
MSVVSGHFSHFDNSWFTAICCPTVLSENGERWWWTDELMNENGELMTKLFEKQLAIALCHLRDCIFINSACMYVYNIE